MKWSLSTPDTFGTYWLSVDHKAGPAIFPSKKLVPSEDQEKREVVRNGTFLLLISEAAGFAVEDGQIKHFNSVDDALGYLNELSR